MAANQLYAIQIIIDRCPQGWLGKDSDPVAHSSASASAHSSASAVLWHKLLQLIITGPTSRLTLAKQQTRQWFQLRHLACTSDEQLTSAKPGSILQKIWEDGRFTTGGRKNTLCEHHLSVHHLRDPPSTWNIKLQNLNTWKISLRWSITQVIQNTITMHWNASDLFGAHGRTHARAVVINCVVTKHVLTWYWPAGWHLVPFGSPRRLQKLHSHLIGFTLGQLASKVQQTKPCFRVHTEKVIRNYFR